MITAFPDAVAGPVRTLARCRLLAAALLVLLMATGCKVDLYTTQSEQEANEMMAVLLRAGIDSDRKPGDENTWVLRADSNQRARAVLLLKDYGYPKDKFDSMGDIFKKQGLVTSPQEDRIRFIYALQEGLSKTISCIDGVINARVHIVLPENNPNSYKDVLLPSSAAVFIKHQESVNIATRIPQIKELVVNSIEGLTYDKVTVVLVPAKANIPILADVGSGPPPAQMMRLKKISLLLAVMFMAVMALNVYLFRKSHLTVAGLMNGIIRGFRR